jgi:hypothetical protein
VVHFHLHYGLSRRQRFAAEIYPWLPCLAACLGFTFGVVFLSTNASRWFIPLLVLPPIVCRNFIALLFDLAIHPARPAQLIANHISLGVTMGREWWWLPLSGIIQVFRSGDSWTILHLNGAVLTVPADAIAAEQIDYLKAFAMQNAQQRRKETAGLP